MTPKKKRVRHRPSAFMVVLDSEDQEALERASEIEKLTKSDIVRRAVRAYYRKLRAQQSTAATG